MDAATGPLRQRDEAFDLMRTKLLRFIARRVESPETAEDLTQEVLLRLVNTEGHIDNLTAWLYRVARNVLIDHYRTRRTEARLDTDSYPLGGPVDDPFAPDPQASRRELAGCLRSFVGQLPEPYRSAVVAIDLDGGSQAKLARTTGLSTSGIKSRVQRGRRQLHQMLTDCCPVHTAADGTINDYQANPNCKPQCDSNQNPPARDGSWDRSHPMKLRHRPATSGRLR
jgi:RNA polymerase sigma-70 factor (ECF subfamily)